LALNRSGDNYQDTYFAILDNDGNITQGLTNISNDSTTTRPVGRPDIAVFSTGNIMVAWSTWESIIHYVVLDTGLNIISGPTLLSHPAMRALDWSPLTNFSLAPDESQHIVVTWMDSDSNNSHNLYYALINSNGTIETEPMIFLSSENQILSGEQGYSNTSYTFEPTTSGVDSYLETPDDELQSQHGTVTIPIQFGNLGSTTASSITITATLSSGLIYIGDTSGITPTQSIQSFGSNALAVETYLTWEFSSTMEFLGNGQFELFISTGDVEIGASYPVTITISSFESEDNPVDNTILIEIIAIGEIFVPLVMR